MPVQFDADTFEYGGMKKDELGELFDELEFKTLKHTILETEKPTAESKPMATRQSGAVQGDLFGSASPDSDTIAIQKMDNIHTVEHEYHFVDSEKIEKELLELLVSSKEICFDTETTGLDPNEAKPVGISFSVEEGKAYYKAIPHHDKEEAKKALAPYKAIFEDESKLFIGQNIKYDLVILKWLDIDVKGALYDTMLAHYVNDPSLKHNMDYLATTYLNYEPVSIVSLIGAKGKKQLNMGDLAPESIKDYACEDADVTYRLYKYFSKEIEDKENIELLEKIEFPLIKVLTDMEVAGINVDEKFLLDYNEVLTEDIIAKRDEIYTLAGGEFNIDSPKQVGEILFDKLKIAKGKKTKTGQYSTSEDKLNELSKEHKIVEDILAYRGLMKLKNTYVKALPKMLSPKDNRVHTQFNQALAATGRLSSSNPNLQNIPIKTSAGREVRKAFIPRDKDHVLIAADYSQIELRLIAEISGEPAMIEAFQKGLDIHTATAAKVYKVGIEDVDTTQRRNAKTVNFSIIYGAGAKNLSKNLGISMKEAKELIQAYKSEYAGLDKYMNSIVNQAREEGYVKTLLGRKRYLRDINSRSFVQRGHAERNAINSPIQGTAADMIKVAMINIHNRLQDEGFKAKLILQVHDELIFDTPKDEVDRLIPMIEEEMKNALPGLNVPIEVGTGIGDNWLQAH